MVKYPEVIRIVRYEILRNMKKSFVEITKS
jgi:ABC-type dipeptide/oligopeptide/nickel transport system permease subunit